MIQVRISPLVRRSAAFSGMVTGIALFGAVFGFLATFIGMQMLESEFAGFGGLVGAVAGMVIGYPIGVIIGIFLVNKLLHYRGSLLLGIIGGILGALIPIGLAEPLGLNDNPDLLWAIILLVPPLLGTIGFHLRGRKSSGET